MQEPDKGWATFRMNTDFGVFEVKHPESWEQSRSGHETFVLDIWTDVSFGSFNFLDKDEYHYGFNQGTVEAFVRLAETQHLIDESEGLGVERFLFDNALVVITGDGWTCSMGGVVDSGDHYFMFTFVGTMDECKEFAEVMGSFTGLEKSSPVKSLFLRQF